MTNFNHEFQAAQQNYKAGNYQNAGAICSNILKLNPTHPESLLLTGMVMNKLKNHTIALQFLERAAIFHPSKYAILAEKAISNIGLYKYDEAEYLLAESIRLNPKYEKSQIQLAICKKLKKDAHCAEEILKNWLILKPNSVSALNNLANIYVEQNRMNDAEKYFQKTLEVDPNNAKAIINMGYCQQLRGKIDEAEELYRKGLRIAPTDSFGIAKLALLTSLKGETDKALAILNSVTKHNIIDTFILNAFGNIFIQTGEIARAKNAFLESLKINPDKAETLTLLGQVYNSLSHFHKAEEAFTKSIELNPWVDTPKIELCSTYQFLNKEEEAFDLLTELHEKLPDNKDVFFALARLVCDMCEWDNRESIEKKFITIVQETLKIEKEFPFRVFNFNYFNIPIDIQLQASKQLALFYSKQVEAIKKRVSFTYNWPRHQRIRLGYISPDFRSHPIGQVIYHLFQYHNRNEFEVYAYSLLYQASGEDCFRDKIKADVDHFSDISKISYEQAATQINNDEIDILIDLAGYTTFSKAQILALRPSPVQMLFMGQPDSSGADFIDYYIADKVLIPEENQQYYTEKIIYLPTGYFGSPLEISDKKYLRSDFGIPDDAFVFCCFCNPYKYEPVLFSAWMEILKQVKNGVLWLNPAKSKRYKENILRYAKESGIDSSRIFFAERLPHPEYMARYQICDLFLDTLHYSAGSTAISALMAGVPVITIKGTRNAENMGASICSAANLNETICNSVKEYVSVAINMAKNPSKLSTLKQKLKNGKEKSPLFDVKNFVSILEIKLKEIAC